MNLAPYFMVDISLNLPESFFDEEYYEGYHITQKMKEVHAIQLNIWQEVDKVCKKYNIPYWADGGTLLGAARHQGFIPWDFDIDLMMLRDDYEHFQKVASKEFPSYLSLNNHRYLQIKDDRTFLTKKEKLHENKKYGIFIDIFPFDNAITKQKQLQSVLFELAEDITAIKNWKYEKYVNKKLFLKKFHKKCKIWHNTNTSCICNFTVGHHSGCIKSKNDFKETILLKFEGYDMPVPKNYQKILDDLYGDWETPKIKLNNLMYYVNTDMNINEIIENNLDWKKDKFIEI